MSARQFVVSYRNSTSNHNDEVDAAFVVQLYLIEILHQTTTARSPQTWSLLLYLIEILHQTTTTPVASGGSSSCILSKFYIKPQLLVRLRQEITGCILSKFYIKPQHRFDWFFFFCVVSYRNSTSNHNLLQEFVNCYRLYLIEILHQTTTSGLILIDKVLLTGCLPL